MVLLENNQFEITVTLLRHTILLLLIFLQQSIQFLTFIATDLKTFSKKRKKNTPGTRK